MTYRYNPLTQPINEGNFGEAARLLVIELVKADGNQVTASDNLGVNDRTFRRWVSRLGSEGFDLKTLYGRTMDAGLTAEALTPEKWVEIVADGKPGRKKKEAAA